MDRVELEQCFRERVSVFRREYFWYSASIAVLSVGLLVGFWFSIFLICLRFRVNIGMEHLLFLITGLMILFLLYGYYRYRKTKIVEEEGSTLVNVGARMFWLVPSITGIFILLLPLYFLSSLPYFFFQEFLKGRHILTSEEVVGLAFEILADGGERVDQEFLDVKFAENKKVVFGAVRLLVELKLFLVKGKKAEPVLLRTIEGQEFLRG